MFSPISKCSNGAHGTTTKQENSSMSELNKLLRQAARITAGISPNTERAEKDHEGDAAYVTALAGEKKASTKKADSVPNTPRAEDDHKGDAAYITALDPKVGSKRKQAEFGAEEDEAVEFEGSASPEVAGEMFSAAEECAEGDENCVTNADIVEALEDVKQGIEDAKVEAGDSPAADLLSAIQEVIEAVDAIQDAVSEDAMSDPEAKVAFKTAANFKEFFIRERNIKAAKVIRQKLAAHQAAAAQPKKTTKRAFDPSTITKKSK